MVVVRENECHKEKRGMSGSWWRRDGAAGSSVELRGGGAVGHRIDAICSHLITSRQHTPQLPQQPPALPANMYENVIVKKELDDSDTSLADNSHDTVDESYINHHHHHHQYHHRTQARHHSARSDAVPGPPTDKDKFFSTHHSPTHSALAALTDW